MAIKKVFKSFIPSVNYVTQKGRTCSFIEGRFLTDVPEEVAELSDVCNSKSNPHIYIDPDEQEVDTTVQERLQAVSQKAVLEELEKIAKEKAEGKQSAAANAQTNVAAGATLSASKMLNVGTTASMASLAAQSNQK